MYYDSTPVELNVSLFKKKRVYLFGNSKNEESPLSKRLKE